MRRRDPLVVVGVAIAGCASGSYVTKDQRAAQGCYDHAPHGNGDPALIRDRETARLVAEISETRPLADVDRAAVAECIDRYLREKRERDVH